MTEKDGKLLAEFEVRMRQLMYLCDVLRDENTQLKQELGQKDTVIQGLTSEVEKLRKRYDNLRFAHTLSSDDEEGMQQAKKRLSKLVRDVDRCIAMLKG
ncbi:MAG: hypothetical protein ACK5KT_05305 [Dysgonomonas sp.]